MKELFILMEVIATGQFQPAEDGQHKSDFTSTSKSECPGQCNRILQSNGSFKEKKLPVGVYYYVMDLKNGGKKLSGSVAIIK